MQDMLFELIEHNTNYGGSELGIISNALKFQTIIVPLR